MIEEVLLERELKNICDAEIHPKDNNILNITFNSQQSEKITKSYCINEPSDEDTYKRRWIRFEGSIRAPRYYLIEQQSQLESKY